MSWCRFGLVMLLLSGYLIHEMSVKIALAWAHCAGNDLASAANCTG